MTDRKDTTLFDENEHALFKPSYKTAFWAFYIVGVSSIS
jgi:hypothetical protein